MLPHYFWWSLWAYVNMQYKCQNPWHDRRMLEFLANQNFSLKCAVNTNVITWRRQSILAWSFFWNILCTLSLNQKNDIYEIMPHRKRIIHSNSEIKAYDPFTTLPQINLYLMHVRVHKNIFKKTFSIIYIECLFLSRPTSKPSKWP